MNQIPGYDRTDMPTILSENELNPERWMTDYGRTLLRYTMCRVRNLDTAEDIIQETFASAIGSMKYFRGTCSEKTWLFSILKHKLSDHFRSLKTQQRRFTPVCSDQIPAGACSTVRTPPSDPCREYESKEFFIIVQRALLELPRPMALSFYLYELEGLPKDDICRLMDIKTGNFYVILSRARKRIRRYLQVEWFNG